MSRPAKITDELTGETMIYEMSEEGMQACVEIKKRDRKSWTDYEKVLVALYENYLRSQK